MNTDYTFTVTPGTVYFVGAGPGAPDLITVRGQEIIAQADLILYADSLVEESVAGLSRKATAQIATSSGLHLEQMLDLMIKAVEEGGVVARVHSGDPALYGAVHEQMAHLEDHNVPYEVVPGVTAAFAVAADLKTELTVPDVVQTIILTRTAGRTTMPEGEDLQALAAPGASLAIYLSISRIKHVVNDLLASGGYTPETPVAVYHKVTWPDESSVVGTLADIVEKVKAVGYTKHALILVSPALDPELKGEKRRTSSHLYDKTYTHRFRRAVDFKRDKEKQEAAGEIKGVIAGEKHLGSQSVRQGRVVIGITKRGSELAAKLAHDLKADCAIPEKFIETAKHLSQNGHSTTVSPYLDSALAEIRRRWSHYSQLVLVMPSGVAIRAMSPLLGDKTSDPAVVCLDEAGQSIIPLLGGHQAGANGLAEQIAAITQGHAAITTASDVQGKAALDLPPTTGGRRWAIDPASALTHASASLVNDEAIGVFITPDLPESTKRQAQEWLATSDNVTFVETLDDLDLDAYAAGLIISHHTLSDHHQHFLRKSVLYRPAVLIAGMGCKRDVPAEELREALHQTLQDAELAIESMQTLTTVDLKADEVGLRTFAKAINIPLQIVSQTELQALEPANFSPSAAQEKFNLPGVAEPCAVITAGAKGQLIVPKRSFAQCTVAIALGGSDA